MHYHCLAESSPCAIFDAALVLPEGQQHQAPREPGSLRSKLEASVSGFDPARTATWSLLHPVRFGLLLKQLALANATMMTMTKMKLHVL